MVTPKMQNFIVIFTYDSSNYAGVFTADLLAINTK